jgi:hypothetical protein
MPQTTIVFYKEEDGQVPVLTWLRALQRRDRPPRRPASPGSTAMRPWAPAWPTSS